MSSRRLIDLIFAACWFGVMCYTTHAVWHGGRGDAWMVSLWAAACCGYRTSRLLACEECSVCKRAR